MLKLLHQLQRLECEQKNIENEKKNCQEFQRLVDLKKSFDENKEKWINISAEQLALKKSREEYAGLMKELSEKVTDEKAAIYDGSTDSVKALNAREAQIASLEEKLNQIRLKDNSSASQLHRKSEEANSLKAIIEDDYKQFQKIKDDYQQLNQRLEQRIAELEEQISHLLPSIPREELAWFEENKERFAGTPVAFLDENHVCDGCRTIVTPILYKRTVLGRETYCEKCGRALYTE